MKCEMRLNDEKKGVELIFDGKPSKDVLESLKSVGFRWHKPKKFWYARQSDKTLELAYSLSKDAKSITKDIDIQKNDNKKFSNIIADHHNKIGSTPIYNSSEISLFTDSRSGYFKDINIYFHRYNDHIKIVDLDNAQKVGNECKKYSINCKSFNDVPAILLHNNLGIDTVKKLYEAVKSGGLSDDFKVYESSVKGVNVFTPFIEQKLIKTPKTWTKSLFQKALMSGQIYSGILNNRYTDDYAYDAAYNFGRGRNLNILSEAKDIVEGYWSKSNYLRAGEPNKDGVIELSLSDSSESKTFYYLENCNLIEAKRKQEVLLKEKEDKNEEMENRCICFDSDTIDSNKIYTVKYLDEDRNTNLYNEKSMNIQGFSLLEKVEKSEGDPLYNKYISCDELEIECSKLYEIANYYNRREVNENDDRIIELGNYKKVVSGKGLLELTKEGCFLNHISIDCNLLTFEQAKAECIDFINGNSHWLVGTEVDYNDSLQKLINEENRINNVSIQSEKPGIDELINEAEKIKIENNVHVAENKLKSAAPKFVYIPEK